MRSTFLCLLPRVHVETAVWHIIRSFSDLCQQVYENNNVLIVWLHHHPRWSEIRLADALKYLRILILHSKVSWPNPQTHRSLFLQIYRANSNVELNPALCTPNAWHNNWIHFVTSTGTRIIYRICCSGSRVNSVILLEGWWSEAPFCPQVGELRGKKI